MKRLACSFGFAVLLLAAGAATAQNKQPLPAAYLKYAAAAQIPPHLLYAVAVQESNRKGFAHPWPWTANIAGKAYYFNSRIELYQALSRYLQSGKNNFDVGLMQINWRYNAALFGGDLWQATDPYQNLAAGARYLKQLKQTHGTWPLAVAHYHVGNPNTPSRRARAERYRSSVWAHLMRARRRFS